MKYYKFAAIDIGSNAVRLLLSHVYEGKSSPIFKKVSLHRVPLRLGDEAFTQGIFSKPKQEKFIKTMQAFRLLIDVFEPDNIMACATSAMREANNADALVKKVKQEAGISIEIISGSREAEMIYMNHIESILEQENDYLYIDVGGGSTELTYFENLVPIASRSFNIGTVRLLSKSVKNSEWKALKKWIKTHKVHSKPINAIGSGGNINKYIEMCGSKKERSLSYTDLETQFLELKPLTVDECISTYQMKPDRADVIVPAGKIYTKVMKWANCSQIHVPEIGLADGMVHYMYEKISD